MAKIIVPEHPIKKEKFEEIWDFLIEKIFQGQEDDLIEIRDILLKNCKKESQKMWFEFSFNPSEPFSSFRFLSYSTGDKYWEKKEFCSKIKKIFTFYKIYDTEKLEKIFSIFPLTDRYRLYFGFEQAKGQFPNRLKIYFDKLSLDYSKKEKVKKINEVCRLFSIDHKKVVKETGYPDSDVIIAVDFFSTEEDLKIYNRYKKLDPELINKFSKNNKTKRIGSTINTFLLLDREKNAHFYILYRFSKHSLKSIKINKVYDFKNIKDINNSLKEMEIFIKKFDKKGEKSWQNIKENLINKYPFFPAAMGVDYGFNRENKVYLYLGVNVAY